MSFQRPLYCRSDLRRLIEPESIAVVGASPAEGSFGYRTIENLAGFSGRVYGVNPKYSDVLGRPCLPSLADLPEVPDLVILAVGQQLVEPMARAAAEMGVGSAIVYASGFRETGSDGAAAQDNLLKIAQTSGMRIVGPNCVGLANVSGGAGMNFMTDCGRMIDSHAGPIGIVSQSGAVGYSLLQAVQRGIGVSKFLACGNSVDVDVADYISYLAEDPETRVIVCLMEGVADGGRFLEALRKADRAGKPVIVYKAASGQASSQAAMSHTGTLAGSAAAYDAAFEKSGAVKVDDFEALIETAAFFARNPERPTRPGLGIMATSGGAGVICADKAEEAGLPLPPLDPLTVDTLRSVVPGFGSLGNPADLTAEVLKDVSSFSACLGAFGNDPGFGAIVIPLTFVHETTTGVRARFLTEAASATDSALAAVWMNEWLEGPGSDILDSDDRVTLFRSPARCMQTIRRWYEWHDKAQRRRKRQGSASQPSRIVPESVLAALRQAEPGSSLTETAAKEIIASLGIKVPAERLVPTPENAVEAADDIGYPVVLKIVSPDIQHKSDVGGVRLDLKTAEEVREAAQMMLTTIPLASPQAKIHGLSVQAMLSAGPELLLGARQDPVFGPLIMLGTGGTLVEILRDVRVRLAPLDRGDAAEMVSELRLYPVLQGARGEEPHDIEAVVDTVVKFSELVCQLGELVSEIELNPIRVTRDRGPVAADALIVTTTQGVLVTVSVKVNGVCRPFYSCPNERGGL